MEGGSLGSPNLSCLRPSRRLAVGDTAQRGEAATKGARVCDPQELCRPPSVLTNPARRSLSTCCGSQSRAPLNRRGPRGFGQILRDCKSALRVSKTRQADAKLSARKALLTGKSASSRASAVVGDERICVRSRGPARAWEVAESSLSLPPFWLSPPWPSLPLWPFRRQDAHPLQRLQ